MFSASNHSEQVNPCLFETTSKLQEIVRNTILESWDITIYANMPKGWVLNRRELKKHWEDQATQIATVLDEIGEWDSMGEKDNEVEAISQVWDLLVSELRFQTTLQEQLLPYCDGPDEITDPDVFPCFADMIAFLHRNQASIAVRLIELYGLWNNLTGSGPLECAYEGVAA